MNVGDYARYKNTGTVGRIVEIKVEGNVTWALLDTYNLYYDLSTLEEAGPEEHRVAAEKEKGLEEKIEEIKKTRESLEEAEKVFSRITPSGT
ncbi:MAG: DUF2098 family protein [Methanomassiliicoccales archaeon]